MHSRSPHPRRQGTHGTEPIITSQRPKRGLNKEGYIPLHNATEGTPNALAIWTATESRPITSRALLTTLAKELRSRRLHRLIEFGKPSITCAISSLSRLPRPVNTSLYWPQSSAATVRQFVTGHSLCGSPAPIWRTIYAPGSRDSPSFMAALTWDKGLTKKSSEGRIFLTSSSAHPRFASR